MFEGIIEELTRATMADYDRLVRRMQLEGDARRARAETTDAAVKAPVRRVPKFHGFHRPNAAH